MNTRSSKQGVGLTLQVVVPKKRRCCDSKTFVTDLNQMASELMKSYDETVKDERALEPTFYCSDDEKSEDDEEAPSWGQPHCMWTGLSAMDESSLLDIFSCLGIPMVHLYAANHTVYDKIQELYADTANPFWSLLNSLNELLKNDEAAQHLANVLSNRNLVECLQQLFQNKSQA